MSAKLSNTDLGLRVVSAVVMLAIFLTACWLGGLPFLLISIGLSILLFYEWQDLVRQTPFDGTEAVLTMGFALLLISSLLDVLLLGLIGFIALGLVLELVSSGEEKSDVR